MIGIDNIYFRTSVLDHKDLLLCLITPEIPLIITSESCKKILVIDKNWCKFFLVLTNQ